MRDLSNEAVIHVKKDKVEYLQYRKLLEYSDIIKHAYSLKKNNTNFRTNGKSMNEGDFEKAVNNYKDLCYSIGCNYINIVKPNQQHTDEIKKVIGKVQLDKPDFNLKEYDNTDGFITNKNGLVLATTNADCILLMFFDPVKKVIANVHSGWRGTFKKISIKAVEKMIYEYGCNPKDIICTICPSIRKCHFEVQKDVRDTCYEIFKDTGKIDGIIEYNEEKDRYNIDTVLINKIILQEVGLKEDNIIDSKLCSVCNSDLIHSYRVEKEGYGLSTALITLL